MGYRYRIMQGYGEGYNIGSGIISDGIIRAVCDICLGIVCYTISEKIRNCSFTLLGKIFITCIEIIGWATVFLGLYKLDFSHGTHLSLVILLVFLVAIIMSKQSFVNCLFRSNWWDILGTASLWIYLFHYDAIERFHYDVIERYDENFTYKCFPFLCAAIVLYILLGYGTFRLISAYKDKIKRLFVK